MKVGFTNINNLKIEYLVEGKGPDFLFLPGGYASFRSYIVFIHELSKSFKVWCPTLPGSGRSSKIPSNWGFDSFEDITIDFIKQFNLRPHIAGHSLGGALALKLKDKYPNLFKSIFLFAPYGLKVRTTRNAAYDYLNNRLKALIGKSIEHRNERKDILLNLLYHFGDARKVYKIYNDLNLIKYINRIDSRIVTFWGSKDKIFGKEYRDNFNKQLKNNKSYILNSPHGFLSKNAREICKIIRKEILYGN